LSVCAAILSLVSRALALVFSTPRSTLAPTVSLPSAFRAASAWSSADSFLSPLTLALILSFASTVFSLALSHASEVVSLVLSQASEVFSLTVSLASTALFFSVLLSSALMAGMALRLMPSATARAAVASLYMAGPPRGWWVAKPTPAAEAASGLQQLLGNLLHIGPVHLARAALGGAARLEPRLEHADDVRGARVLGADGLRQRVGQLLLDGHQLIRFARPFHSLSRRTNFWTLPVEVLGRSPNSTAAG